MPRPRKELVCVQDTPYYHVVSRCVRRAFLCGLDQYSGKNFDHRKPWLVDRLALVSSVFSIGLCSYAIMSNHYHLVVRIDEEAPKAWSSREVARRWNQLFSLPFPVQAWLNNQQMSNSQLLWVEKQIETYRDRLSDLGWYMRSLNEYIARKANKEDDCTGRFWEGRYKSQALLDEHALLTAMAYVDLNPIRAAIAKTPESSDFTSVQKRIAGQSMSGLLNFEQGPVDEFNGQDPLIPFALPEYLDLVDYTGRVLREDKRGSIPEDVPPVFSHLGIDSEDWMKSFRTFNKEPRIAHGGIGVLSAYCERLKQRWLWGMGQQGTRRILNPG